MVLDHHVERVIDLGGLGVDQLARLLDGGGDAALLQLVVDERLEELERHLLGQAALVELELGADHDDRAARVVDALAEQVLAEAALLALEGVGERLEGAVVLPLDGAAAPAVVEQRVDRLLQHALLVADDHLGRAQLEQPLEAVVAVDDAAVEVVEVARGEAAAVEGDQRTQLGRDDGDLGEDHPLRAVARVAEGLDHLEALGELETLLDARLLLHPRAQLLGHDVHVDLREQVADGLGAHAQGVVRARLLGAQLARVLLGDDLVQAQARLLVVAGIGADVGLEIEDALELLGGQVEQVADARGRALEEPDVADRRGEVDVAHALAAHLGLGDLDAAALAHHALVLHALVLAARALPVGGGAEDLRAEEPVPLRLEGAVVDGLRLGDLAVRPLPDLLRGREHDLQRVDVVDVDRAFVVRGLLLEHGDPPWIGDPGGDSGPARIGAGRPG
jgi:hypothetical protein